MTLHVKAGGVWRTVDDPQVRVSGTWRPIQEGWVRVAGVWRQFYSRVVYQAVATNTTNTDGGGGTLTIQYNLLYDSDGLVRHTREISGSFFTSSIGQWSSAYPSETGSSWSVRVRHIAGTNIYTSGDGLNTWDALTSDRNWLFSDSVTDFNTVSGTYIVEISNDGGSTVYDSESFTVTLFNEGP